MAGLGADFWVCAGCRSVNNLRAKQCYNCRTPRERAAVDPSSIDPSTKGGLREIELPDYSSPRPFAIVASILILGVAGLQVLSTIVSTSLILQILDGTLPAETEFLELGLLSLAGLAVGVLALVAWSAWLASAVGAMPALGLGYPPGNSLTAFVENFLPGLNLLRVPAIVRDVVRRLEPQEGRGDVFIFVAWIGLFGGLIVPRVGGWLGFFGGETIESTVRNQLVVQGIAVALVLVGAIFLVFLIWWIQERIEERRAAQLRGEPPPQPLPPADGPGVPPPSWGDPPILTGASGVSLAVSGGGGGSGVASASPGGLEGASGPPGAAGGQSPPQGAQLTEPAPMAGPLGTIRPPAADDAALHRPITAVAPLVATPDLAPTATPPAETASPEPEPALQAETALARDPIEGAPVPVPDPTDEPAAPAAPAAAAPALAPASEPAAGPRLLIRVSSDALMASLDGEPEEPISLDELREAAPALARAGGSASIASGEAPPALLTTQVLDLLRAHGVRTERRSL